MITGISALSFAAQQAQRVEANCIANVACISEKIYKNPFIDVQLDAVITRPDGVQLRVPMFWAGGNRWSLRYASSVPGIHTFRTDCSDNTNAKLHGLQGKIEVAPYRGENPLYRHGPISVAGDKRHFEHTDGAPFFWLADTWWKGLCKRMTWEGFQELTADRKAKGFSAIQIVCGPYPDENMMEARWENEGGKPYETRDFSVVNPKYFDYADRRIKHLVDAGIVPVLVGGWGRPQRGGNSTIAQVGIDGYKRHWRNLIARYGAYPVIWMVGGEAKDSQGPWSKLAEYLKDTDPYHHPLTYHAPGHPRKALRDNSMFDFDMVAIGHNGMATVNGTLELIKSCLGTSPPRPVLCGEACYEGHMQTNFQYIQRHMFWTFIISGAAGHITPVYDLTTWKQAMDYPGSTQLGIGKRLLEKYPWSRFEPHPEWVEDGCFAAGIPGEVRIIYLPRRNIYNWSGPTVKNLEPHIDWHVYYFDPATGRKFDHGTIKAGAKPDDKTPKTVDFKENVPSPQDWLLVFERAKP